MSNENLGLVFKFKLSSEFPWRQTENFSYIISTVQCMLGVKKKKRNRKDLRMSSYSELQITQDDKLSQRKKATGVRNILESL